MPFFTMRCSACFLSGDEGRTTPSVAEVLGVPCTCAELDVLDVPEEITEIADDVAVALQPIAAAIPQPADIFRYKEPTPDLKREVHQRHHHRNGTDELPEVAQQLRSRL